MDVWKAEGLHAGTGSVWSDGHEDITREGEVLLGDIPCGVGDEVWGVATGGVAVVLRCKGLSYGNTNEEKWIDSFTY